LEFISLDSRVKFVKTIRQTDLVLGMGVREKLIVLEWAWVFRKNKSASYIILPKTLDFCLL